MTKYSEEFLNHLKRDIPLSEYIMSYMDITTKSGKLFALCPFHYEDTPSFMIDPQTQHFHCFGCGCRGDIFDFIMKIKNISFSKAVEEVAELAGTDIESGRISETYELIKVLGKEQKNKAFERSILDKSIYDEYKEWVEKTWVDEGVPIDQFARYEIRLDKRNNRIVYPVYDSSGNFINIKGRSLYPDFKARGIPKYINYYKVGKRDYLQGLHLNRQNIINSREMIIFEGVKSCMKAEGFGYHNVVSAESSDLNIEQVELILSLHVNVVIAFDKDKPFSKIYNNNMKTLNKFITLYYIDDVNDLLGDATQKNSPVDCGKEVWEELYKNRKEVSGY